MILNFSLSNLANASPESWRAEKTLHKNKNNMGMWAFRSITADFEFLVDNVCVFKEDCWNIGELAVQLAHWLKTDFKTDFHYDCMDAEEKDLFTFKIQGDNFLFYSEWDEIIRTRLIDRDALVQFIPKLTLEVDKRIKWDLGLDAGYFLSEEV